MVLICQVPSGDQGVSLYFNFFIFYSLRHPFAAENFLEPTTKVFEDLRPSVHFAEFRENVSLLKQHIHFFFLVQMNV